jgi:hypothetical protein
LTALVGQAFVQVPDDEYLNVDVLWQVLGLRTQDVARRRGGARCRCRCGAPRFA